MEITAPKFSIGQKVYFTLKAGAGYSIHCHKVALVNIRVTQEKTEIEYTLTNTNSSYNKWVEEKLFDNIVEAEKSIIARIGASRILKEEDDPNERRPSFKIKLPNQPVIDVENNEVYEGESPAYTLGDWVANREIKLGQALSVSSDGKVLPLGENFKPEK